MANTNQTPNSNLFPKKRGLLVAGSVLLAFSLYLLFFLVPDVLQTASGPRTISLSEAARIATEDTTYARIEGGQWDCETIVYIRGRSSTNRMTVITRFTEIFLTDALNRAGIVLLAQMSGEVTCSEFEEIIPTGYLTRMSEETQQTLTNDARLARYFDATEFLELCGYCGQENSLIGVIFGIVFALGGIAIIILGLRMPADNKAK